MTEETPTDEQEYGGDDVMPALPLGNCPHCREMIYGAETPADCPHCGKPLHAGSADAWRNAVYVFKRFLNIRGRASRREYWSYTLFMFFSLCLLWTWIDGMTDENTPEAETVGGILYGICGLSFMAFNLVLFFPWLGVTARRLHDIGLSSKVLLVHLIPLTSLGWLIYACACIPGILEDGSTFADNWHCYLAVAVGMLGGPVICLCQMVAMLMPSDDANKYGPPA